MTPRWIGEYEIVRRLRVGGMATLFLARRHGAAGFSRLVALKVVHPHLLAQPTFVEMFVSEARICAQISHPNVVHVEEFGVIDETHYLVMEYIDGCSVGDLLQMLHQQGKKLDPELAARILMQVAGGLHAAHETLGTDGDPLEIIHRDISPSNILLSADGHVKLIDFGVAKARNRIYETEGGVTLKGKYKYVAPEQATRAAIDRRSDIFSLGVVFWELLVGEPLFSDDSHVGLFNRLHETNVRPPSEVNPDALVILDSIVMSMLRHDPAERPQTALEVQRRIAAALPGAANRDTDDLGKLVTEVRAARLASGVDEAAPGSDPSFSPTPRARPHHAPDGYQAEVKPMPASNTPQQPATMPQAPASWSRRAVRIGIAGVLGLGMMIGLLLGLAGREGSLPAAPPAPLPAPPVQDPSEPPAAAAVVPEPAEPAPAAASPPEPPEPAPAAAAVAIDEPPPEPASAEPPPRRSPARPAARTPPHRAAARPRAPREPVAETPAARPAAPARPSTIRSGKGTFADLPFDDSNNTGATTTTPSRTKVKKTTIVTDFDN